MVVGRSQGPLCGCGLGMAIGPKDKDCELSAAERTLLLSTLRWLGERAPVPRDK